MKRPHTLIAEHFGMDSRDVYETRHHYGRTARPIYVLDGEYYCVSRTRPTDEYGNGWEPLATLPTTTIWVSKI